MASSFIDSKIPRYMGGRRNLAEFLHQSIEDYILLKDNKLRQRFLSNKAVTLDMCSGSAVLTRMLRHLGWVVHSQDSEPYAYNWANYIVQTNHSALTHQLCMFQQIWGVPWEHAEQVYLHYKQSFLQDYYTLHEQCKRNMYNTNVAKVLDQLWSWSTDIRWYNTPLLHAFLKYEIQRLMMLHANTSGTLNSWHNQRALEVCRRKDINQIPSLDYPWTIKGAQGTAYQADALDATNNSTMYDMIVFDPPQTVHQYSSCYHLLNSYATNNTLAPLELTHGGTKSGINHTPHSSIWNKPPKHTEELIQWVKKWTSKTRWIVTIQQNNSFCSVKDYQKILSCYGTHHIETILNGSAALHIVQINKKNNGLYYKVVDLRQAQMHNILYIDPENLPPNVQAEKHSRGWYIIHEKSVVARLGYSLKVQWCPEYNPSTTMQYIWQTHALTTHKRFLWLLRHKYWASALNCLVINKKEIKHDVETYWSMLYHLVISHGAYNILKQIRQIRGKPRGLIRSQKYETIDITKKY